MRKLGYGFLFAFHRNYGSILYRFRDKARYWPKIDFFSHLLHSPAPLRVSVGLLLYRLVWKKKLSYRKQVARQLRTQYVHGIYSNSVTLKSESEVSQGHAYW